MARKPHIHLPGGLYHVILRGNGGQPVFLSDEDRYRLYMLLQEVTCRFGYRVHAFCFRSAKFQEIPGRPYLFPRFVRESRGKFGLEVIEVPGATGYLDTNFEGKAQALLRSIEEQDFCYLHLEAPDEAAHNGDVQAKIQAIELFDARIIGPVIKGLQGRKDVKVLLLCDHLTPIAVRTHTDDPVPFLISSLDAEPQAGQRYTEAAAQGSGIFFSEGHQLLGHFLK